MMRLLCVTLAVIGAGASMTWADSVRLLPSARVPAGKVTLAMVATIEGDQKVALGEVVVANGLAQVAGGRLTLDGVMEAVHAAGAARRGVLNAGRVAFHGSACELTLADAIEPVAASTARNDVPQAMDAVTGVTLQSVVAERLPGLLGLDPARTRLTFDEADRRVLNGSTEGAKVDVKVLAMADRVPLQVVVYQPQKNGEYAMGNSATIRVGVEVERTVVAAIAPLRRGDVLDSSLITTRTEWLPLSKKPLEVGDVVGAAVKSPKVAGGAVLLAGDVEPAVVVRKGQVVTIHCVSGQFVIKVQARATEAGKVGQTIKFAPLDVRDRKDTRSFLARVETAGRAIMTVGGYASEPGSER
jgi:flagella basal body P-ring formation protein FlgA